MLPAKVQMILLAICLLAILPMTALACFGYSMWFMLVPFILAFILNIIPSRGEKFCEQDFIS